MHASSALRSMLFSRNIHQHQRNMQYILAPRYDELTNRIWKEIRLYLALLQPCVKFTKRMEGNADSERLEEPHTELPRKSSCRCRYVENRLMRLRLKFGGGGQMYLRQLQKYVKFGQERLQRLKRWRLRSSRELLSPLSGLSNDRDESDLLRWSSMKVNA